jgi:iron complex transport system ATP-binding protein
MIPLEIKNVTVGYAHQDILMDISFDVPAGQMVGLIGPNGSGKSTLIRTLSRVISPHRGSILLNGTDISRIKRSDMARSVGVVPQVTLLPSAVTAFEVVLMGRNPHLGLFQHEGKKEMDIAWDAMGRTGVQHLALRRIGELSGGEIQCIVIARVLAQETGIILLDEPTANLDIGRQIDVMDLFRKLCTNDGLTMVVALHDLNLAAQYCDRVLLINDGRIHAQGSPSEVITPENIRDVYKAEDCVYSHPANNLPAVLLKRRTNGNGGKDGN